MTEPLSWSNWLAQMALLAARKSKDETKVGALLTDATKVVRLTAFNGPPRGVADRPERFVRPTKYLFASHAEANLIAFAAREGIRTERSSVWVTHLPCASCARTLIQAGIAEVRYGPGTTNMPETEFDAARTMFREAGVRCEPWESDEC